MGSRIERPQRVELLAPAGSREAFTGALSAGADAVYLGGEQFGARAYAENFSEEEILRAIGEAHVLGRRVYLTANILIREKELPDLVSFVSKMAEGGLDGVIVQDLGVLSALREACPGLPLHASTQLSVTGAEAVRYLQRLGVSRVVPARELSIEEIRTLRREAPAVEVEAFIHGAMCYSYSGRCLMSSFLGGRSGNRGRCAGTCRLPYRVLDEKGDPAGPDARKKEVWPLSMKDMCVLPILPELIDAGIHSFKIEGRMKKPVYAAGVTAVYRKYIDRFYEWEQQGRQTPWIVEESDLEELRSLYIRTELGTGYYHQKNGRSLVTIGKPGYAGTDGQLEERIREKYLTGLPKQEIEGMACFRIGEPARLRVRGASGEEITVEGPLVQKASGRPLDPAELRTRLSKTGDSLFSFSGLHIESDEQVFLPVSAVNALRREALQKLQEKLQKKQKLQKEPVSVPGTEGSGTECSGAAVSETERCDPEDPGAEDSRTEDHGTEDHRTEDSGKKHGKNRERRELWAMVSTRDQMDAAMQAGCAWIIIDGSFGPGDRDRSGEQQASDPVRRTGSGQGSGQEFREKTQSENIPGVKSRKIHWICALPPVFRVSYRERILETIRQADSRGFDGILVRTLEELQLVKEAGYAGGIIGDASLYGWNSRSIAGLLEDCSRLVCPLELNRQDIRMAAVDRFRSLILPVYGRVPMMESAGCVRKTEKACTHQEGFWYLEDRMGKRLPVRCRCGECSNTVYNAVPLSLHQFMGRGLPAQIPALLCMFTTETGGQTGQILDLFGKTAEGREEDLPFPVRGRGKRRGSGGKKDRGQPLPFTDFTNGHFRSGAT